MRLRTLKAAVAAGVTLAAAVLGAAPASADSIAYIKAGDIWLATPDGARQLQVTHTGGYASVSQADDGTMIALAPRERLHRLSRTGAVLSDFPTYVSDGAPTTGPVNEFHGPFSPEISPDGKLVAFEWFNENYENGNPGNCTTESVPPCQVLTQRQGVGITRADGFTGFEEFGLMTGWIAPQWTSNSTLLRSGSGAVMNEDSVFTTVGPAQGGKGDSQLKRWFWDERGIGVDEVEISRDQRTVVGIAGFNDEFLRVYRPLFDPATSPAQDLRPFANNTPVVESCFEFTGPAGGRFESPTIAPDGRGLAWSAADGVHTTTVPDLGGACAPSQGERLAIPGGRSPDWGPADVPAASTVKTETGDTPDGRTRAVGLVAGRPRLGLALRRGLPVTVTGPAGVRVSVTALVGRKVAGSGTARLGARGTATVRVRFGTKARRSLAARSSVRLTLKAVLRAAGAASVQRTAAVTLRR